MGSRGMGSSRIDSSRQRGSSTTRGQSPVSQPPPPPPGPPPGGAGLSRRVGMIGGGAGGVVCTCGENAVLLTVRNEQSANKGMAYCR